MLNESTSEQCGGGWFSLAACGGQQQGGGSIGGTAGGISNPFTSITKKLQNVTNILPFW